MVVKDHQKGGLYGTEAVLPVEVAIPSLRVTNYQQEVNDDSLLARLDLLPEMREEAATKLSIYQDRITRYYNRRVKHRPLKVGDLVLRNAEATYQGQQLKAKGKGMPVLRARDHGDLHVQLSVETPQKLTKRQKELLQEFDKHSSTETQPETTGFFSKVKDFLGGLGNQQDSA